MFTWRIKRLVHSGDLNNGIRKDGLRLETKTNVMQFDGYQCTQICDNSGRKRGKILTRKDIH